MSGKNKENFYKELRRERYSEKELYVIEKIEEVFGSEKYYTGIEYLDEIEDWKTYVDSRIKEYIPSSPGLIILDPIDFSKDYKIEKIGTETIDLGNGIVEITNYD